MRANWLCDYSAGMTDEPKTEGQRKLLEAKADAGLFARQVAAKIKVSPQTVAKYLVGQVKPTRYLVLAALLKHYGIKPLDWSKPPRKSRGTP